jgi:magnesium transporter
MITIWKENGIGGIVQTAILERNCWIQVVAPTAMEIETLHREYHIHPDVISDILDLDERSRCDREEDYTLIITRVPVHDPGKDVAHYTIPLGIILVRDLIITISLMETDLLKEIAENKVKNLNVSAPKTFVLRLMQRSTVLYLRYLKEINRRTAAVEDDLHRSIKNVELVRLLAMEKSLVFFTTSIRSNELLLEKLNKVVLTGLTEAQADLFEDVAIEYRQALEMANIYSNILSGMMDAFASVISNNLNVVMKRLTMISIILMIPTLFASIYGMNVGLPLQKSPWAFWAIVGASAVVSVIGMLVFLRRQFAKRI